MLMPYLLNASKENDAKIVLVKKAITRIMARISPYKNYYYFTKSAL